MKSIGEFFQNERVVKGITLSTLADITKIKRAFLVSIEKGEWNKLPEYPVLLGFIKSISRALEADEAKAVALFRRDYPHPKEPRHHVNPKQPEKEDFRWNPKLSFLVGVVVLVITIVSYLGYQYVQFTRPPALEVFEPTENQVVKKTSLKISGKTDPSATIVVNNQPVLVDDDGTFTTDLDIFEGTADVVIVSESRSGKTTVIKRTIKPDL